MKPMYELVIVWTCYFQIFFYSAGIFANAGVKASQIQYAVMGTNAVNVAMTIVAVSLL